MRRIKLTISYDGTRYAGWQRQENAPSVQQKLEEALFSLTGERAAIIGASRTDAGVHALGQAAHFDTDSRVPPEKFSFALNTKLPEDIRVMDSREASHAFHARYGAIGKTYRYQIENAPHATATERLYRAHVAKPLDVALMRRAAMDALGEHDFAAFAAAGSKAKTTVRDIREIALEKQDERIDLTVSGRSFLYNMVRILAGTLIYVGMGKLPPDAIARALETKNRLDLGVTAPAKGLTLVRVDYERDV